MLPSSQVDKNISKSEDAKDSLPKEQRLAVIFLSILGLAVLVFWAWQFKSRVSSPFKKPANQARYAMIASSTDLTKDTDGDGLTDYEEINIYHTSPYLADSDSDGISDGQEVKAGTDPNCPTGQTCGLEAITPPVQSTSTLITGIPIAPIASTTIEEKLISGDISPAELRQVLLANGADKLTLDQVSDADLIKGYQETIQAQLQNSLASTSVATSSSQSQ